MLMRRPAVEYKAVIFDLFETLITEWGHEKYTKKMLCADLGVDKAAFDVYWKEKSGDQYIGKIRYEEIIEYVCEQLGRPIDEETMARIMDRRIKTKAACFDHVLPEVYELLRDLRSKGLKLAILSNCSSEEVMVLRDSALCEYFDEIILSYEAGMKKPDPGIYEEAVRRLGVRSCECLFVGDGGSNELEGAKKAGMTPVQAKWYTNRYPEKRETIGDFSAAEEPIEVLELMRRDNE